MDTVVKVGKVWIEGSWIKVGWKGGLGEGRDCSPGGLNLLIRFWMSVLMENVLVRRDGVVVTAWVVIGITEGILRLVMCVTGTWNSLVGGSSSSSESKAVISAAALLWAGLTCSLGAEYKAGSWLMTLTGGAWEEGRSSWGSLLVDGKWE